MRTGSSQPKWSSKPNASAAIMSTLYGAGGEDDGATPRLSNVATR